MTRQETNAPGEYCPGFKRFPSNHHVNLTGKEGSYMDPPDLLSPPVNQLPTRSADTDHHGPSSERPAPSTWKERDVCEWVRTLPFKQSDEYADMFQDGAVNGPLLLQLTDELLVDIGITRKIHRARILLEIQNLDGNDEDDQSEDDSLASQCDNTQCDTMDVAHITEFFGSRIRNFKYLLPMFEMRPWWMQFCDDFKMKPPDQTFYPVRIRGVRLRNHSHASSSINDTYRCFGLYRNRPAYISDHRASKERRLMLWFNDRRWQVSFFTPQAIVENRRAADVQDQAECAHEIAGTAVWRVYHKSEKVFHEDRNVQISILPQALVDVIYHSAAAPFTRGTCVEIVSFLDL